MTSPLTSRAAMLAKLAIVVVGAGAMLTLALQQSVGFAIAAVSPRVGSLIAPRHSETLAAEIQLLAARQNATEQLDRIRPVAVRAFVRAPRMQSSAAKIALIDELSRRSQASARLFRLVANATLRQDMAHVWAMADAYKRGDYEQASREVDVILRHGDDRFREQTLTMANLLVADGKVIPNIVNRLEANPSWRRQFLYFMALKGRSIDNERRLWTALRRSSSPPTNPELDAWFTFRAPLMSQQQLLTDYMALSSQPFSAAERYLRDGQFEGTNAVGPFKWKLLNNEHALGSIGPAPGARGNALFLDFSGRVGASAASQMLTAGPGRYRITWRANGVASPTNNAPAIQINCTLADQSVSKSEIPVPLTVNQWRAGSGSFTVPANCARLTIDFIYTPSGIANQPVQFYLDDLVVTPTAS